MDKFGRQYILTIEGDNGISYQFKYPTTLQFSVQRNILASCNKGRFLIRNLNSSIRNSIFKARFQYTIERKITLQAGYSSNPLSTVFKGNILECKSYRDEGSVDFITEIDAFDMSFPIVNSTSIGSSLNISPTPLFKEVIKALVEDLVKSGAQKGIIGNFPGRHHRPYSSSGNTWELLQAETNKHCFFDNGKVNCLQDSECLLGDLTLISSATGLLGTPKITDNYLTLQCLFEPRAIVGQQIYVQSRTIPNQWNQIYKVIGLSHEGTISGSINGKCKTTINTVITPNITLAT